MPATAIWAQVTAAVREPPAEVSMTLIHRDYHPQNTLWSALRLTEVVDWTQASWGPPSLDLGHMRWNLVADHGQVVADRFLACYRVAAGATSGDQPFWDLVALLDLLLDGGGPGDIQPDRHALVRGLRQNRAPALEVIVSSETASRSGRQEPRSRSCQGQPDYRGLTSAGRRRNG